MTLEQKRFRSGSVVRDGGVFERIGSGGGSPFRNRGEVLGLRY